MTTIHDYRVITEVNSSRKNPLSFNKIYWCYLLVVLKNSSSTKIDRRANIITITDREKPEFILFPPSIHSINKALLIIWTKCTINRKKCSLFSLFLNAKEKKTTFSLKKTWTLRCTNNHFGCFLTFPSLLLLLPLQPLSQIHFAQALHGLKESNFFPDTSTIMTMPATPTTIIRHQQLQQ